MKTYILISVLILIPILSNAQHPENLDTIYANDHKNVAMIFPRPISQGITGAEHFVFTYNREKQQHFGLLQAKPGEESNLLVICADGSIYSYIVKYKKQLFRLNYFIPETKSIGNEKPIVMDSVKTPQSEKDLSHNPDYHQRFSSYLLSKKQRIARIKKRRHGIILGIDNIVFNKDQLYFVIRIENRSSLDYDLNFLKLATETRKKGKKKSLQRLYQDPVFKYNLPAKIKKNQITRLVWLFRSDGATCFGQTVPL